MKDLSNLHYNLEEYVDISGTYSIPKEYIDDEMVDEITDITVTGRVEKCIDDHTKDYIKCNIKGIVKLKDSISLEPVDYEININYEDILDDFYKKSENKLDIFQLLWENIELEVPLRFTKVEDLSKFQGNGWKLISEEDVPNTSNNPFKNLSIEENDEEVKI